MMVRRLFLICLMAFSAGTLRAADNYVRDSLLVCLENTPNNELRLKTLYTLVTATQDNVEECQRFNQQLLEEAVAQNSDNYKCEAYFMEVVLAYNSYDAKRLTKYTDLLIPLARKIKNYNLMFRAWRCKIDFMILSLDLERNEREAKEMLAEAERMDNPTGIIEAYQCLGNIYNATYRKADAIAILEKALPIAQKIGDTNYLSNIWQSLISLYSAIKDYPKWIKLLNEAEYYISRLPAYQIRMQHLTLLIIYTSYTRYYTETNNPERATYYTHRAKAYLNDNVSPLYVIYFNFACAKLYYNTEQYERALQHTDSSLALLKGLSSESDYHSMLALKADILNKMNQPQDAIRLYKDALAFKDKEQVVTINKQYEQLKKYFNADQLQLAAAELRHRVQIYTLILLGISLTVIAVFIGFVFRNHRMLRTAREEMLAVNERMELVNEAKNRFLSNISTTIREPLNTVVEGSLCLAGNQITDEAKQHQLSVSIRKMSANLLKVINNILDLSRLEAGMMKFETVDAELTSLLYDAVCAVECPENKVEIRNECPEGTLYMVRLDGGRLMQVFKSMLKADKGEDGKVIILLAEHGNSMLIRVTGSTLTRIHPEQGIIICNEINRMLITRFGGTYAILGEGIELTIPIAERLKP